MKFTPPKKSTFWVSVIIAAVGFVVGLLGYFGLLGVPWLGMIGLVLLAAGFVLLALGLTVKGL